MAGFDRQEAFGVGVDFFGEVVEVLLSFFDDFIGELKLKISQKPSDFGRAQVVSKIIESITGIKGRVDFVFFSDPLLLGVV